MEAQWFPKWVPQRALRMGQRCCKIYHITVHLMCFLMTFTTFMFIFHTPLSSMCHRLTQSSRALQELRRIVTLTANSKQSSVKCWYNSALNTVWQDWIWDHQQNKNHTEHCMDYRTGFGSLWKTDIHICHMHSLWCSVLSTSYIYDVFFLIYIQEISQTCRLRSLSLATYPWTP